MQKSAVYMFVISNAGRNLFFVFLRSLVASLCRDDIFAVFVISTAERNLFWVFEISRRFALSR